MGYTVVIKYTTAMNKIPLLLLMLAVCTPGAAADRPNIVLFIVDDLGWQDSSLALDDVVPSWQPHYKTPHLEALASEGMRFTAAYASAPVCTPTRTSIMTGQAPARHHITYWILHKDRDTSASLPAVSAPRWRVNGLTAGDVTLPRILRKRGYVSIHAGKAHLGAKGTPGDNPENLGFTVNIAGHGAGGPADYRGKRSFAKDPAKPGKSVWDIPGLEKYHGKDIFLTEALALEASAAIAAAARAKKPFFLHFAPYAVHAPIQANERLLGSYQGMPAVEAAYATMIESVDNALGTIRDTIEKLGLTDDTIIIFTSDNGGLSAHARAGTRHIHNRPLRSGKGSAYEGGVRVPTVIHWPGVTAANTLSEIPIISHDFFPTILALAGTSVPKSQRGKIDGKDLTPLLGGDSKAISADRPIFWHMPHFWGVHGPGIGPYSGVRVGSWKLLYFHSDRRLELYNLEDDIGEVKNLASSEPERLGELAETLSTWLEEVGASMSIDKKSGEPVAMPRALLVTTQE